MTPALVVKLGGSYAASPLLRPWLRAIAAAPSVVLVPGGGPFADTVRAAQKPMGFSDAAAHEMAVLGMVQYGLALADLADGLDGADSEAAIASVLAAGRVPVWMPRADLLNVAASWDVTADSLALLLARQLGAPRLLLVKQRRSGEGLLDAAFGPLRAGWDGAVFIAGPDDLPQTRLDPGRPPGIRLP